MIRKVVLLFIGLLFSGNTFANADSTHNNVVNPKFVKRYSSTDSAWFAKVKARKDSVKAAEDSVKALTDSLHFVWIKVPVYNRPNRFIDSLIDLYQVRKLDFQAWAKKFPSKKSPYKLGKPREKGETWFVAFIVFLLLFFAVLKNAFSKELSTIIRSFYSNRALNQINKEDSLFSSWPFIFLYILFGFTIGAFLYLCARYFQVTYILKGFQWLLVLSFSVIGLFTFKIFVIRLLGFLFDAAKPVGEYTTVLFLSYFNAAILFLPLVVAFSFAPARFAAYYIYSTLAVVALIFIFQFLRAGAIILSNYRFPKIYLFLYICALEICPLLILIKALRF